MKFGKVENIAAVDFSLPNDHPLTEKTFQKLSPVSDPEIFIGCPVWADKGYVGKVYPNGTKNKDFLKEYCKQFNSIEVNATHYNIPQAQTIEKWKQAATPGFQFCPKFPQHISHRNDFDKRDEWIDLFLSAVYQLDEHLGPCFIQFPPFFKTDKMQKLSHFVEKLPRDLTFAIELRHESWFENNSTCEAWYDLFSKHRIIPIITDTSGRRDVLHQIICGDQVFIRFTGNNLHPSDYSRIDDWVERIIDWTNKGIRKVYFFMHEPEKHLCADLAIYMIKQLNQKGNFNIKPPTIYTKQSGQLF